jgi:hypothetical protein
MKPKYHYGDLRKRCERIARMRNNRARQLCREAGLDPNLLGIHPHNAMCSFHDGKPWPEVNYSKCRATIWMLKREFEPMHVLDKLYKRLGPGAFIDMQPYRNTAERSLNNAE